MKRHRINMDVETEMPSSQCCECGHSMDRVSGPISPVPGDLTLCIRCGSLNALGVDMRLRAPTQDEMLTVAADPDFQRARRAILTITGNPRRAAAGESPVG